VTSDELAELVRALLDKVRREQAGFMTMPATAVTSASSFGEPGRPVVVHIDGDPPDHSIEVQSLVGAVQPGQRVQILFDPPRGAFIVGRLGESEVPAGRLHAVDSAGSFNSLASPTRVPFTCIDYLAGGVTTNTDRDRLFSPAAGIYRCSARFGWGWFGEGTLDSVSFRLAAYTVDNVFAATIDDYAPIAEHLPGAGTTATTLLTGAQIVPTGGYVVAEVSTTGSGINEQWIVNETNGHLDMEWVGPAVFLDDCETGG
jgi:hypothetical protein